MIPQKLFPCTCSSVRNATSFPYFQIFALYSFCPSPWVIFCERHYCTIQTPVCRSCLWSILLLEKLCWKTQTKPPNPVYFCRYLEACVFSCQHICFIGLSRSLLNVSQFPVLIDPCFTSFLFFVSVFLLASLWCVLFFSDKTHTTTS